MFWKWWEPWGAENDMTKAGAIHSSDEGLKGNIHWYLLVVLLDIFGNLWHQVQRADNGWPTVTSCHDFHSNQGLKVPFKEPSADLLLAILGHTGSERMFQNSRHICLPPWNPLWHPLATGRELQSQWVNYFMTGELNVSLASATASLVQRIPRWSSIFVILGSLAGNLSCGESVLAKTCNCSRTSHKVSITIVINRRHLRISLGAVVCHWTQFHGPS